MTAVRVSENDLKALGGLSLFCHLGREELIELTARLSVRHFDRGEVLYHHEDQPRGLFFLMRGRVKVRVSSPDRQRQVTLSWVKPVSHFGVTHVFANGEHHSDAVAMEPSDVLIMKDEDLKVYLFSHPEAAMAMMEDLAQRMSNVIERFYDFGFLDVPGRLVRVLLKFAEDDVADSGGAVILRGLTQREIASLVGTTRESVNKWMLFFERQGWIEFSRGQIKILQPALLLNHVQEL